MAHLAPKPYLNRENMVTYLNAFATIMKQTYGNISFDMLIVGGSAIALKNGYRNNTMDIDSDIRCTVKVSDAIKQVAMIYGIYEDWLNQDFMYTESYSRRLTENAIYYTTLQGVVNVYLVNDLDQLCMKATAYRQKDLRDIRYLITSVKRL